MPPSELRASACGESHRLLGVVEVGDVGELGRLLLDRGDHARMAVARRSARRCRPGSRGTRCPPRPRASRPGRARTRPGCARRSDHVLALERLQLLEAHPPLAPSGTIIVPWPSLVNSSSSRECGTRPSTITALGTPPSHRLQAGGKLGAHAAADAGKCLARARRRWPRRPACPDRPRSLNQPATSVRNIAL